MESVTFIDLVYLSDIIAQREPRGKFWSIENGVYIAVDNSTGEAWTEEFKSLPECIDWLENSAREVSDYESFKT